MIPKWNPISSLGSTSAEIKLSPWPGRCRGLEVQVWPKGFPVKSRCRGSPSLHNSEPDRKSPTKIEGPAACSIRERRTKEPLYKAPKRHIKEWHIREYSSDPGSSTKSPNPSEISRRRWPCGREPPLKRRTTFPENIPLCLCVFFWALILGARRSSDPHLSFLVSAQGVPVRGFKCLACLALGY